MMVVWLVNGGKIWRILLAMMASMVVMVVIVEMLVPGPCTARRDLKWAFVGTWHIWSSLSFNDDWLAFVWEFFTRLEAETAGAEFGRRAGLWLVEIWPAPPRLGTFVRELERKVSECIRRENGKLFWDAEIASFWSWLHLLSQSLNDFIYTVHTGLNKN